MEKYSLYYRAYKPWVHNFRFLMSSEFFHEHGHTKLQWIVENDISNLLN